MLSLLQAFHREIITIVLSPLEPLRHASEDTLAVWGKIKVFADAFQASRL